jgi:glycosyltransferase involved in cell wall biosynthesis
MLTHSRLPLLSVVAPAFNEAACLPAFHSELMRILDTLCEDFDVEVLFVDDGSRDETPLLLEEWASADSRVHYLCLSRNFGHQAALSAGLEQARGDIVISLDADLQHPPALIRELLRQWQAGHDIVLTLRQDGQETHWFKAWTSALFYRVMRSMSGMEIRPGAADFRLMSRHALDAFLRMPERNRFVRGMIHWLGFRVAEVHFTAPPRFAGKSKYTLIRMVRLARDGLLSFSRVPLHASLLLAGVMIGLSWLTSSLASIYCLEGSYRWLVSFVLTMGHATLGGLWLALVAFSEYLARIHEQVLQRPLYVVARKSSSLAPERQVAEAVAEVWR